MTNQSITAPPAKPRTTGRMSTLTPAVIQALCDLVAKGNYNVTACNIVGVSEPCFYAWLQHGQEDIEAGVVSMYSYLFKSIKDAEARAEAEMVERVRSAALPGERKRVKRTNADGETEEEITETGGDWLAAATYLERRYRERWGRPAPTQVTVNDNREVTITQVEVVLSGVPQAQQIEAPVEGKVIDG